MKTVPIHATISSHILTSALISPVVNTSRQRETAGHPDPMRQAGQLHQPAPPRSPVNPPQLCRPTVHVKVQVDPRVLVVNLPRVKPSRNGGEIGNPPRDSTASAVGRDIASGVSGQSSERRMLREHNSIVRPEHAIVQQDLPSDTVTTAWALPGPGSFQIR